MSQTQRVFAVILITAAVILLVGSWTPFQFTSVPFDQVWDSFWTVHPLPQFSRSDVVVNFWLGFPVVLGMCGWLAAHRGSIRRRFGVAIGVVSVQVLLSLAAELGQGWLADRTSSIFDFGLQVAGAVTAVVIWQFCGEWISRRVESLFDERHVASATRLDAALALVAAGVLIWSVMPLDVVTSPAELARKYRSTGIELVPFQRWEPSLWENIYQWVASFVLGCPLGLWWGRWVVNRYRGRITIYSLLLVAIGIGMLPELLQIPIRSRVASATDAVFLVAGSILGTLFAVGISAGRLRAFVPRWRETWQSPGFWLTLLCLQMLAICLLSWLPLDFSTDAAVLRQRWHEFMASPFRGLAGSDTYNVLTLFRSLVMGAVLGWLAAMFLNCLWRGQVTASRRHLRQIGGVVVIGGLAVFVLAVELGQLLELSRTCSMLSVIVQQAGMIVGYWLGRTSSIEGRI